MNEIPGLSRAVLHRARISRDARFDGKFYIAVLTTGVYCRPTCPSPCSKKSHVRYYATAAEAAAAGYRACRRCRPEVAPGTPAWLGPSAVVRRALRLIQEGALDAGKVDELALRLGVGARHLDRLFAEHVGVAPLAVAQTRRLHFASTPSTTRRRRPGPVVSGGDEQVCLTLTYRPPYDWDCIATYLARGAIRGLEQVDDAGYARTIRLARGHARLQVAPVKGAHALRLQVWRAEPADLFEIATTARRVFDLAADPAAIADVLSADPVLRPLVMLKPGLRIPGVWDVFECAVRAVLAQRTSILSERRMCERLVQRFGERIADGPDGLTHLFPSAARLAEADLTTLGMSAARSAAVRALARAVLECRLDASAPAEEVMKALGAVPGVTSWVAQYVALRALGEPDAFPSKDLLLRRLNAAGRSAPRTVAALERLARAWRPWRGYATLYLWKRAAEAARH